MDKIELTENKYNFGDLVEVVGECVIPIGRKGIIVGIMRAPVDTSYGVKYQVLTEDDEGFKITFEVHEDVIDYEKVEGRKRKINKIK